MDVNILLFENFETLDAFGPAEILGRIGEYDLRYYSASGGKVTSAQKIAVITEPVSTADKEGILVIPGGLGTRLLVNDASFLGMLKELAEKACFCLAICTGSALLAKCGVLDHKRATSNKKALEWVKSVNDKVIWVDEARWVTDGRYYTSSGVSAGMDMALGFVCDRFGRSRAEEIAEHIEYIWNDDPSNDPFAGS